MELYAPKSWHEATEFERFLVVNGCGSANAKFDFVPDSIWFLKITDCCEIHDWQYDEGETLEDKQEADRVYLNNMLRKIEAGSKWLKPLRRRRALKYYEAVTVFGGPAYWDGKNV